MKRSLYNIMLFSQAKKNYYDILGLPKNATKEEIKDKFYQKAKLYHPDVNPGNE